MSGARPIRRLFPNSTSVPDRKTSAHTSATQTYMLYVNELEKWKGFHAANTGSTPNFRRQRRALFVASILLYAATAECRHVPTVVGVTEWSKLLRSFRDASTATAAQTPHPRVATPPRDQTAVRWSGDGTRTRPNNSNGDLACRVE